MENTERANSEGQAQMPQLLKACEENDCNEVIDLLGKYPHLVSHPRPYSVLKSPMSTAAKFGNLDVIKVSRSECYSLLTNPRVSCSYCALMHPSRP